MTRGPSMHRPPYRVPTVAEIRALPPSGYKVASTFSGAGGSSTHSDALDVNFEGADMIISFLACMFLPPESVWKFLLRAKEGLRKGGALVILEKLENRGGYLGSVFYRMTLAEKLHSDPKRILEKELSLAAGQRPLTDKIFKDLDAVEFFRFGDFAGYIVEHAPRV